MTTENTEEEALKKEIWDGEGEEPKPKEEDLFKEEEEEKKTEEPEGKGKKTDSKDQKLETVEEKKNPSVSVKARVRKKQEEQSEIERRVRESEASLYKDEDFVESQKFEFSNNSVEVDGEQKSLNDIAKDYPDVAALIKDAIGKVKKELGAPLASAQDFIEDTRFWQKVERVHPEARSMSANKEFMEWIDKDVDLQTLSSTGDPEDIVFVIDQWKIHTKPKVDVAKEAKKSILAKSKVGGSTVENKPKPQDDGEDEPVTDDIRKSIWG